MSIADDWNASADMTGVPPLAVPPTSEDRPLHRIAEIRKKQGISLRSAARRMKTSLDQVRRQEDATTDMPLSDLYRWQESLQVPIAELLVDLDDPLSAPIMTRARLVRVMKTAQAIKESSEDESVGRLCQMLEQQLVELMPELKDVSAWHAVGQRRTQDELGRAVERTLPESFFTDM